jgi:hypothetical protein
MRVCTLFSNRDFVNRIYFSLNLGVYTFFKKHLTSQILNILVFHSWHGSIFFQNITQKKRSKLSGVQHFFVTFKKNLFFKGTANCCMRVGTLFSYLFDIFNVLLLALILAKYVACSLTILIQLSYVLKKDTTIKKSLFLKCHKKALHSWQFWPFFSV